RARVKSTSSSSCGMWRVPKDGAFVFGARGYYILCPPGGRTRYMWWNGPGNISGFKGLPHIIDAAREVRFDRPGPALAQRARPLARREPGAQLSLGAGGNLCHERLCDQPRELLECVLPVLGALARTCERGRFDHELSRGPVLVVHSFPVTGARCG